MTEIAPTIIRIESVDTEPEAAGHHRSHSELRFDPDTGVASVVQVTNQSGQEPDVYHGRLIALRLDEDDTGVRPEAAALRRYLESEPGQALLRRIAAGHSTVWNGQNEVGRLTDAAEAACEALQAAIAALPGERWQVWSVEDWLAEFCPERITAATTDAELVALEAEVEGDLDSYGERISLTGSIRAYLTKYRDSLRD